MNERNPFGELLAMLSIDELEELRIKARERNRLLVALDLEEEIVERSLPPIYQS